MNAYPLLDKINFPSDLRNLANSELPTLAKEIRDFLLTEISRSGGHFAAGLGVVELTIALHKVFNTPNDQLVWDVGHQAYPHKVLTGRKDRLGTVRQTNGLHPFPWPGESEYDTFAVGHSSTSISAALGMAASAKLLGSDKKVVSIIGDGAMTAGQAFEAMNHATDLDANLLVILNDNDMSISENVGGLNRYLAKILSSKTYAHMRDGSKKVLGKVPPVWELARKTEEHVKGIVTPANLFESLGFHYTGPIDGHDLPTLIEVLDSIKDRRGPQFLHVVTKKGKGYAPAEKDPIGYHGVPQFDPSQDELPKKTGKPTFSAVFGEWLTDMAKADPKLVAITPAMREGSGMVGFSQAFKNRYFDVGIAEQHSITLAAGFARGGMKPVAAIYSTFLQRAYDQLIHDVALQNLDVLFAIDRGGLVGGDGATHNGAFDLSYLRCIPNMIVMTPSDEALCRNMLYTGYCHEGPAAVRYPRGGGNGAELTPSMTSLKIGKGEITRLSSNKNTNQNDHKKIALLAFGTIHDTALKVAKELDATVADMRFVKPLDTDLIDEVAKTHDLIVTLEENVIQGGAGSAVNEYLATQKYSGKLLNLGFPDAFIHHGDVGDLMQSIGLDEAGILSSIAAIIEK